MILPNSKVPKKLSLPYTTRKKGEQDIFNH